MKNQVYQKKKNEDGTDYIDPITNDFVMELILEENIEIPYEEALKRKLEEIDLRTKELIYNGFNYKGVIFSMSSNAQANWIDILNYPLEKLPKTVFGKDDESYVVLKTKEDLSDFYYTALNFKDDILVSGKMTLIELKKLKTSEEIENFKDTRQ